MVTRIDPKLKHLLSYYNGESDQPERYALVLEQIQKYVDALIVVRINEELTKADDTIAMLRRERGVLQEIATRRSDRLQAAGLHSDCTQDEALAIGAGGECLKDVVSHASDFAEAIACKRQAAREQDREELSIDEPFTAEIGSSESYWVHQEEVLRRMVAQAKAALSAVYVPPTVQTGGK